MTLSISYKLTEDLFPYAMNSRTHSDEQVGQIAASIMEFGFTNPILVDEQNSIIAGHGRLLAAQRLKLTEVPTIELAGLTEAQRKAYVIADNKITENGGWDVNLLESEIERLKELDFNIDLLALDDDLLGLLEPEGAQFDSDNPYTQKVEIPVYEPTGDKPALSELYQDQKAVELAEQISASNLPAAEKSFLLAAASRHIVLDFEKIANYYAHASQECQELMENSALVIIDFDKAIENGYVALTDKLSEQYLEDYPDEA